MSKLIKKSFAIETHTILNDLRKQRMYDNLAKGQRYYLTKVDSYAFMTANPNERMKYAYDNNKS